MDPARGTQSSVALPVGNRPIPGDGEAFGDLLARRQAEFEQLLKIQAERRQKEDAQRLEEQRFAMREENLIREAHSLAAMKCNIHAEKISWKRSLEDEVRKEEDARRALEDARRAIEDKRRRQEEQTQMELDIALQLYYEQLSVVERVEKERLRRWIEEDRVRALEDVLIRQDVLDLRLHSILRQHVHNHFNALIGYGATTKEQADAQVEALLDSLLMPAPQPSLPDPTESSLKRSSNGVVIEPPTEAEAPPPYQAVMVRASPPPDPQQARLISTAPPADLSHPSISEKPALRPDPSATTGPGLGSSRTATPTKPPSNKHATPSHHENIEVDDFAVLDADDVPTPPTPHRAIGTAPKSFPLGSSSTSRVLQTASSIGTQVQATVSNALSISRVSTSPNTLSPASSSSSLVSTQLPPSRGSLRGSDVIAMEEEEFDFDLSIQPSNPLVLNEEWEVVNGRPGAEIASSSSRSKTTLSPPDGATKAHTDAFKAMRVERLRESTVQHAKQFSRMMAALPTILDPKFSDYNPFSKLVLSTRDTWEACEGCETYFDRMSIKQTCKTCNRNFCSKCATSFVSKVLDLSLLTSKIPESSIQLRQHIPKTKEDNFVEIKCCPSCDATLTSLEARNSREFNQRSTFFVRQYDKAMKSKESVLQALVAFDSGVKNSSKLDPKELDALESSLLAALRRFQSSIDSFEQTLTTLRNELPINPKTGQKFTTSAEIRTIQLLKSAMANFMLENKQLLSHYRILRQSRMGVQPPKSGPVTTYSSVSALGASSMRTN
jgi:hypothetical protein